MSDKKRVMVLPGAFSSSVIRLFKDEGYDVVANLDDTVDLLCFTGGEDINPFWYDDATHRTTYSTMSRDRREIEQYRIAQELGIPCVGICRGAQLLHVMNGGKMWQDVNMHGREHMAYVSGTKAPVLVSSMHHQMLIPNPNVENIILLTANESTKKEKMSPIDAQNPSNSHVVSRHVSKDNPDDDIEAMFYPETNSLCFQGHPELYVMEGRPDRFKDMKDLFFNFINQYNFDKEAV